MILQKSNYTNKTTTKDTVPSTRYVDFKESNVNDDSSNFYPYSADHNQQPRYPYNDATSATVTQFPYCISQVSECMDVKRKNDTNNALGDVDVSQSKKVDSSDCLSSKIVYPIPKYSVHLHRAATLLEEKVYNFPDWIYTIEDFDLQPTLFNGCLLSIETPSSLVTGERRTVAMQNQSSITSIDSFQQSLSSSDISEAPPFYSHSNSATTITTIVTALYDKPLDVLEEESEASEDEEETSTHLLSSRHNKRDKIQRSFNTYCSFDHPTSSTADPRKCETCTDVLYYQYLIDDDESSILSDEQSFTMLSDKKLQNEIVYLGDILKILWPFTRPKKNNLHEKEPLLIKKNKKPDSDYTHLSKATQSLRNTLKNEEMSRIAPLHHNTAIGFSRVTILTLMCIILSLGTAFVLYIAISDIL